MTQRQPTDIDALAERFVAATTELQPENRVYRGSEGDKTAYQDYSPNGVAALRELYATTRRELDALKAVDDVDVVTKLDLDRVLELGVQRIDAGWYQRDLNNLASPLQEIRDIFDLMPTDGDEDWHDIAGRMANVPGAVDGYLAALREGLRRENTPAARQVEIGARQLAQFAAGAGFFHDLAARGAAASEGNATDLAAGAETATEALVRLRTFLTDELGPAARAEDAVGRDLYELASREFLGARVDLDEYYEWGIEELARMREAQEAVAREIVPGGTVAEAIADLDASAEHRLHGTDELRAWMQHTADEAVAALDGTHFDIPEPVRRIECLIAPTQTGGIYYTGPSEDFSRAGRMWWSVPEVSPSSTPGASSRPSTMRACQGITCRSARPCTSATASTPGAARRGQTGTARAGHSTPSSSWTTSASSRPPPTGSGCSTVSGCAPPASCSTSACTSASRCPAAANGASSRPCSSSPPT